jgi:hypothetical protein
MVVGSLWVALTAPPPLTFVGWFGVVFFGIGLVIGMVRAIRPRPIFVIEDQALRVTGGLIRRPPVKWVDVQGVSLQRAPGGGRFSMVRLDVPSRRMPIGFTDRWLDFSAEDLGREIARRASVPLRDLR